MKSSELVHSGKKYPYENRCCDKQGSTTLTLTQSKIILQITIFSMLTKADRKLRQEIAYLKSSTTFTLHFKPNTTIQLYNELGENYNLDISRKTNELEMQMFQSYERSVFVALKWLVFIHRLFQTTRHSKIIDLFCERLTKIKKPLLKNKWQQYIYKYLVFPYKKYLLKLAPLISQSRSNSQSPSKFTCDSKEKNVYCIYNLVAFAQQTFQKPIKQFGRFFQKFYQSLNDYITLLGKDIFKFLKIIRSNFDKGNISNLTFFQIEELQSRSQIFSISAHNFTKSWLFPQTNANSFQFQQQSQKELECTQVYISNRVALGEISLNL